jgi:hypothetical protein
MRRGTKLIVVATLAVALGGLAGCNGSLAKPEGGVDWSCLDVPVQPLPGTCRFVLPPLPECNADVDLNHIGVKVAGSEIPRDPAHANGWDYVDDGTMQRIDIYGRYCDTITTSPATPVSVVFKLLLI